MIYKYEIVPILILSFERTWMNCIHRKLIKLMTWLTALSNSLKLWAMPCRATQMDRSWWRVLTKCGPLERGTVNHFSILALRTPWTVWKGKKIGHWRWTPNMLQEISGEITPEKMKRWNQSKNNTQLWMWLIMEVKSKAIEQYCIGIWNVRSMNQGKLEVVKQGMARVNIDILESVY